MLDSFVNGLLQSERVVMLLVGGILLLATEFGLRIGQRHPPERRKARQGQSNSLQGALLGLLGLLLGFTFAMAVGRYEGRKQLVLNEANAIGTTWLRAGFLREPARDHIRPVLLDYIGARLQGAGQQPGSESFLNYVAKSERNQASLWRAAVEEVKENNTPSTSLFIVSLNELIDLDSKRQAAARNHVPGSVWLLLIFVSAIVCWTTGYTTALASFGRHALSMLVLPFLLTVVITIIADLDNPQHGLIQISQQSMVDLQKTLKKY